LDDDLRQELLYEKLQDDALADAAYEAMEELREQILAEEYEPSWISSERQRELQAMPYEKYLFTPEWNERRQAALKKASYRCQVCNSPDWLDVHHRHYGSPRGQERVSDLTVLCRGHHQLFERFKKLMRGDPRRN
jgi:5-methylcytosine-specific restriction endonuclease McrA